MKSIRDNVIWSLALLGVGVFIGYFLAQRAPIAEFLESRTDNIEIETENGDPEEIAVFESGVRGQVLLGPNCPVVREGEECPDTPYKTEVRLFRDSNKAVLVSSTESDGDGNFEVSLPPGDYFITAVGASPLPRCEDQEIIISPDEYFDIVLLCDTGIR